VADNFHLANIQQKARRLKGRRNAWL
jgi:hypothetical protein